MSGSQVKTRPFSDITLNLPEVVWVFPGQSEGVHEQNCSVHTQTTLNVIDNILYHLLWSKISSPQEKDV